MPRGNPRVTVGLRVPEKTVELVDAWADGQGLSRSDAFRTIMQAGLNSLNVKQADKPATPPARAPVRGPSGLAGMRASARGKGPRAGP